MLVFPKIHFTDEEQIAFTQTLGTFAPELRGESVYKVLPASGGGDTEFCNTYAAYEDLPDADRRRIDKLQLMHPAWNTLFFYCFTTRNPASKSCGA